MWYYLKAELESRYPKYWGVVLLTVISFLCLPILYLFDEIIFSPDQFVNRYITVCVSIFISGTLIQLVRLYTIAFNKRYHLEQTLGGIEFCLGEIQDVLSSRTLDKSYLRSLRIWLKYYWNNLITIEPISTYHLKQLVEQHGSSEYQYLIKSISQIEKDIPISDDALSKMTFSCKSLLESTNKLKK